MEKIIYVEEGIYIIQKEILRTVKGTDRDMKIWCANSENYGYTEDSKKAQKAVNKLNSGNKRKDIRYVIVEVKALV